MREGCWGLGRPAPGAALVAAFAAALAGVSLLACSEDAQVEEAGHVVSDSAGVRIVVSHQAAWPDSVRRIEPEPILRLGDEEAGPYLFGSGLNGTFLRDGSFAIADVTSREVRVFGATGEHRTTFGGEGDGPGEFRYLAGVWAFPGDSLAATDGLGGRTTIFPTTAGTPGPAGGSAGSRAPRVITHALEGNYHVFGVFADGRLVLRDLGGGYRPDLPAGLQWTETDVLALDASDGSVRVLTRLPSREQMILGDGNTGSVIPQRWAIPAVAVDGFYWIMPDRYEIHFRGVDGEVRRILRRPVEPAVVEPAMIEAYIEAQLERVHRFSGEEAVPAAQTRLEGSTFGEHVPFFARAFVDHDQRLWVGHAVWPALAAPPRRWSVFSSEGVWLGDVQAPDGLEVLDSRGDVVLGSWRDRFDVPHVQLNRIEGL
jgi:hypothetical protein